MKWAEGGARAVLTLKGKCGCVRGVGEEEGLDTQRALCWSGARSLGRRDGASRIATGLGSADAQAWPR